MIEARHLVRCSWPLLMAFIVFGSVFFHQREANAQSAVAVRKADLEWDATRRFLYASFSFRDIVNAELQRKLSRGLPTTIIVTATLFQPGVEQPVSTSAQTCKIAWHVWEEAYRIELSRPGLQRTRWTATLEGVLRRCAQAPQLLVATRAQLSPGVAVYLAAKVQVNPISPELIEKLKRWVSRPSATSTAAPGDALFGTFTGLFLQRIGKAERELQFNTKVLVPRLAPVRKK